ASPSRARCSTEPPTCSSSSSATGAGTPGPRWAPPTCRWGRWSRSPPSSGSSPTWSAGTSRGSAYPRRVLTASLSVVLLDAPIRLNYGIAFAAGLLSFLSPCVFPLLPAYLAYLGGQVGAAALEPVAEGPGAATLALGSRPRRRRAPVLASGVAFVAGFSAVFITLFYVFTALRLSLFTAHRHAFDVGAGIVVVV